MTLPIATAVEKEFPSHRRAMVSGVPGPPAGAL